MSWLLTALKYALFALGVALMTGMAFEQHWHAIVVAAVVIDFAGFWVCDRLLKTR